MSPNPISDDRHALAAELRDLLDVVELDSPWHVYDDPPGSLATPCVVLLPAEPWARFTFDTWSVPIELWIYAEQLQLVELDALLAVLLGSVPHSEVRISPSAQRYGGSTYLAAVLVVPRHVELAAAAIAAT